MVEKSRIIAYFAELFDGPAVVGYKVRTKFIRL